MSLLSFWRPVVIIREKLSEIYGKVVFGQSLSNTAHKNDSTVIIIIITTMAKISKHVTCGQALLKLSPPENKINTI